MRQGAMKKPSIEYMIAIFRESGLHLPEETYRRFWTFHQLLRARNKELDLTRIRRFEDMVLKHYVDCALVPEMINLPSPLLDIGTGAGFPGIPLKLVRPDLELILAEGRGARLDFLEEACQRLGLEDVEIYPHKVSPRFERPVKGVITRALESMEQTLERVTPFLPQGGRVIFMKGPAGAEEIKPALTRHGSDFRLDTDLAYNLGHTSHRRRLIVLERISAHGHVVVDKDQPMIKEIASAQNPSFKVWQKLGDGRGVRKHGLSMVSGLKQVREVLRDFPDRCAGILGRGNEELPVEVPPGVTIFRLRPELFRELDFFGVGPPLLLVRVNPLSSWEDKDWPLGCTLFIPFQDPANVGAIIRTAVAFGAARAVMLQEAAHPFHPRSVRASGPAVFRLPLLKGPSIKDLASDQAPLIALAAKGRDVAHCRFPETFGLVPGVEGPGLPKELQGLKTVSIPMSQGVESLNAALAAGIALYQWMKGRGSEDKPTLTPPG